MSRQVNGWFSTLAVSAAIICGIHVPEILFAQLETRNLVRRGRFSNPRSARNSDAGQCARCAESRACAAYLPHGAAMDTNARWRSSVGNAVHARQHQAR